VSAENMVFALFIAAVHWRTAFILSYLM